MYVCSRRYKVYVLTNILLTFKCICAQEDFINFINFKCICAQEDYTCYQKFLGVPNLGVNTKTRRRRSQPAGLSYCSDVFFLALQNSKLSVE